MGRRLHSFRRASVALAITGLFLGLAFGTGGMVLFLRDKDDFDATHQVTLRSMQAERTKAQSALGEVHQRMARITAEIAAGQDRIARTAGVIAQLKSLDSTWDTLTGDAQQKANSERRAKLEQQQADATAQLAAWQQDYTRTGWERDGLEIELGRLEAKLKTAEGQSKATHYLRQTWNYKMGWMKVKEWVGVLVGLCLGGLTVLGIAMGRPFADRPDVRR